MTGIRFSKPVCGFRTASLRSASGMTVMRGLDPRIHAAGPQMRRFAMDCRSSLAMTKNMRE